MNEESWGLLQKGRHAIRAAEILFREQETDFAAGRAYYAMFYIASALLAENDLRSGKHSGVHALFGEHFAKSGRIQQIAARTSAAKRWAAARADGRKI